MPNITTALESPLLFWIWIPLVAFSVIVLSIDLVKRNAQLMPMMKAVWLLTVFYSGPFGLLVYYFCGRRQISRDSLWRKGWRSTAHCYSGCGAGEIVGVFICVGLFAAGNWTTTIVTFVLAYLFGFGLTVGPLVQEGEAFHRALWDAFWSESASITVMEVVAIGVNRWIGGNANITDTLFWSSLVISLSVGFLAAYPANVLLIHFGIKAGMHDPTQTEEKGQSVSSDQHSAAAKRPQSQPVQASQHR